MRKGDKTSALALLPPEGALFIPGAVHANCFDAPGFTTTVLKNIEDLLTRP